MKRLNPVGSLLGFALTILLFVGLGISLWINQGLAFSPGAVTSKARPGVTISGFTSHASFEKQCGKCHDPLKTNLATKCLECHSDVKDQIQSGQGAHGQIATIDICASCHPEHQGRNFDPTLASFHLFDHSKTKFSLIWHQENYDATPMQCSECHGGASFSIVNNQTCLDCHVSHDNSFSQAHLTDFGTDCQGCHDGVDRMQNYDHSQTGFPLEAKHALVSCTGCHNTDSIKDAPKDCKGCHEEPGMHKALFSQPCETCHTPKSWSPTILEDKPFSHLDTTSFSLALHRVDYLNQTITCLTCHHNDLQTINLTICIDCHTQHDFVFMTKHTQQFGSECLVCHDGVDRLHNFQHDNFFLLDGKHTEIQCVDCHVNQVYRGTPSECAQCHAEPAIHAGIFGEKCYYCHTTDAWSPASLRQHVFPLNHGSKDAIAQSTCETCHGADYVEYTCYNCHDHQPEGIIQSHEALGISAQDIPACVKCHPDGLLTSGQPKP